jgi:hypothetical protein
MNGGDVSTLMLVARLMLGYISVPCHETVDLIVVDIESIKQSWLFLVPNASIYANRKIERLAPLCLT